MDLHLRESAWKLGPAGLETDALSEGQVSRLRVLRVAVAMALLVAVYGAWQLTGWPAGHDELISDLSLVPPGVTAALGSWAASRRCSEHARLRSAWRLTALAFASYTIADLIWLLYTMLGKSPFPSPADGFYLVFYLLLLCGLLRQPMRRHTRAASIRLALDIAVVAIGGAAVCVYLVVGPTLAQADSHVLATVFSVAYPVGDMILLFGLASVLLRGGPSAVLRPMAAGLACFVAADMAFGYMSLHGTYHTGDPIDTLWVTAMACFAISAASQRQPGTVAEHALQEIRSASWLPYVALAATFGLLVFNERESHLSVAFVLVLASVLLTAIVSARQLLTQRDLLQARRELRHKSLHDGLTGLPNRLFLVDQAELMLARARRHGRAVAALYVDIDGFKAINDGFGHAMGDDVLCAVGTRLSTLVRASDVVGRMGGDEFVVLLDEVDGAEEIRPIAERIGRLLAPPMASEALPGQELSVSASVGVAVTREGTFEELLRDADDAMYEVKRSRKRGQAQLTAVPAVAR